jgi:aryl-alcohol dehydrogenase-like predicted oxidoreductase
MSQETLLNALADEVQRGSITCIGVSNYSSQQMRQAYEILAKRGIPLAVNQVQYSLPKTADAPTRTVLRLVVG